MVVRFQTDPLSGPRMARMATALANAEAADALAARAELNTAALDAGAIADMRMDQASRDAVQNYAGLRPPATETVNFQPDGRTIAVNDPPPRPPPIAAPAPSVAPPSASSAPAPAVQPPPVVAPQTPQTSAIRRMAPQTPAPVPPPPPRAPVAAGSFPSPAAPPPAAAVRTPTAGGGNPIIAGQSRLMTDLYGRFSRIPGGGSAALRMASQEANRQLAVLGTVLQMAQTNPQGAEMLLREYGIEVTPETQMMIRDGAIRQRVLQTLAEANARYGPGSRTAGRRAAYLEGRLGGGTRGRGGAAAPPDAPMSPGMAAAAAGGQQPMGPQIADPYDQAGGLFSAGPQGPTRDPFAGGRIVQNQLAGTQEEPGGVYPELVAPTEAPFREDMPPAFQDYLAQEPYAPAATGRPAAAPRASVSGGGVDRSGADRVSALRWATSARFLIPGGPPEGTRLMNPEAQIAAADAFLARQAGDNQGYIDGMRRAVQIETGQGESPAEDVPPAPETESGIWGWLGRQASGIPRFLSSLTPPPNAMGARPGFQPSTPDEPFSSMPASLRRPITGAGMGRLPPSGPAFAIPTPPMSDVPQETPATPARPAPAPIIPEQPFMPGAPRPMVPPQFRGPLPPGGYQAPMVEEPVSPDLPSMGYRAIPPFLWENGTFYNFTGQFTSQGRPIYSHPTMRDERGRPLRFAPE